MGILDEAIKEHLELKRQHGAGESELKKLEDEAFGASERPGSEGPAPDSLAEAPTQFMAQPDAEAPEGAGAEAEPAAATEEAASPRGRVDIADLQEPPVESVEDAEADASTAPADEPSPAAEHEIAVEPPADAEGAEEKADNAEPEAAAGPSTEERHTIAEQPTEMYDVEAELGDVEPVGVEPEVRAASQEPPAEEQALSEEDEEFWDEKRLSDELDQALEAPVELQEPDLSAPAAGEPEPEPEPAEPEAREEAPRAEEPVAPAAGSKHEDALDETPDFLEENPEDDQLWFEQKPPKDFDFDD
jgi:hypothetical protein